MARFEVFAASCAYESERLENRGQLRDLHFFQSQVEKVGGPWREHAYREEPNARRPVVAAPQAQCFFDAVFDAADAAAAPTHPMILVHVHGFASTTATALARGGELSDKYEPSTKRYSPARPCLPRTITTLSFLWPSLGETVDWSGFPIPSRMSRRYRRDRAVAAQSAPYFVELLRLLATARKRRANPPRLALLAHSMGARVVESALPRLTNSDLKALGPQPFFDVALVMAGDCRATALGSFGGLTRLREIAALTQIYYSIEDGAVAMAPLVQDTRQRLGLVGPSHHVYWKAARLGGANCDDVAETVGDDFNHQYYRFSPDVVLDARRVLAESGVVRPAKRFRGLRQIGRRLGRPRLGRPNRIGD